MGHPTLCLVCHNHKRRKALQGQGHVALRSEDIDCKLTAEEFLQKWDMVLNIIGAAPFGNLRPF
eukprot:3125119-Ditylum_brightwellii.AAC.1